MDIAPGYIHITNLLTEVMEMQAQNRRTYMDQRLTTTLTGLPQYDFAGNLIPMTP